MKFARNANAPAMDQGECSKLEGDAGKPETSLDYKRGFVGVKAAVLLAHALSPDTPEGIAAATGAQLIRLWRQNGVTAEEVAGGIR